MALVLQLLGMAAIDDPSTTLVLLQPIMAIEQNPRYLGHSRSFRTKPGLGGLSKCLGRAVLLCTCETIPTLVGVR
jgi:hypothetical protein